MLNLVRYIYEVLSFHNGENTNFNIENIAEKDSVWKKSTELFKNFHFFF